MDRNLQKTIEQYKAGEIGTDYLIGYTDSCVETGRMTKEEQERVLILDTLEGEGRQGHV